MKFLWLLPVLFPLVTPECSVFYYTRYVGDDRNQISTTKGPYGECHDTCRDYQYCAMFTWHLVEQICHHYSSWSDLVNEDDKTWVTGNCSVVIPEKSNDEFSDVKFTAILDELFIGNSRYQGLDYGSRFRLQWDVSQFQLFSSHDDSSSSYGRVGRVLGSVFRPSKQKLENSMMDNPTWLDIEKKIVNLENNGNLERGLKIEIENMMTAVDQAQDVLAFVVVEDPFNPYSGKPYETPLDRSFGPVTLNDGGYVVKLFELAKAVEINNASSCVPLILTSRSNHCQDCIFSTHWEFRSLTLELVAKGLLDGIGMAMNLDESPASMDDISNTMNYYTNQGINVYITDLNGDPYDVANVTAICLSNPRCVCLNLNLEKAGEERVDIAIRDNKDTWISRSSLLPICAANSTALLLPSTKFSGTTTDKTDLFGSFGKDALYKFRVYPVSGVISVITVCSKSDNFDTMLRLFDDRSYSEELVWSFSADVPDCQGASKIEREFSQGWYYLLVEGFNGTQGDFTIDLLFKNKTSGETLSVGEASRPMINFLPFFVTLIIGLLMMTLSTKH